MALATRITHDEAGTPESTFGQSHSLTQPNHLRIVETTEFVDIDTALKSELQRQLLDTNNDPEIARRNMLANVSREGMKGITNLDISSEEITFDNAPFVSDQNNEKSKAIYEAFGGLKVRVLGPDAFFDSGLASQVGKLRQQYFEDGMNWNIPTILNVGGERYDLDVHDLTALHLVLTDTTGELVIGAMRLETSMLPTHLLTKDTNEKDYKAVIRSILQNVNFMSATDLKGGYNGDQTTTEMISHFLDEAQRLREDGFDPSSIEDENQRQKEIEKRQKIKKTEKLIWNYACNISIGRALEIQRLFALNDTMLKELESQGLLPDQDDPSKKIKSTRLLFNTVYSLVSEMAAIAQAKHANVISAQSPFFFVMAMNQLFGEDEGVATIGSNIQFNKDQNPIKSDGEDNYLVFYDVASGLQHLSRQGGNRFVSRVNERSHLYSQTPGLTLVNPHFEA